MGEKQNKEILPITHCRQARFYQLGLGQLVSIKPSAANFNRIPFTEGLPSGTKIQPCTYLIGEKLQPKYSRGELANVSFAYTD